MKQRTPNLETINLVEKHINKNSGEFTLYTLWKNLPKKMLYPTYRKIIEHLYDVNKISLDSKNKIGYIWNPNFKISKELLL